MYRMPTFAACLAALVCCASCFTFFAESCRAGETTLDLGLGLAGEFNDNVNETAHNQQSDFVSHLKPMLSFVHDGGRIHAQADYRGDYQYHLRGTAGDWYAHYLTASLTGEIVENLFFLEVTEDLQPVYADAARGEVIPGDTMQDLVNRNQFRVSPSFRLQPTDRTGLSFGYSFIDTRYSDSYGGNGNFGIGNGFSSKVSYQHVGFGEINHELSDRAIVSFGLEARRLDAEREDFIQDQSLTRYTVYAGGIFALAENWELEGRAGAAYTDPDEGSSSVRPYVVSFLRWNVGRSQFGLSFDMDFTDDPETGGDLQRTMYRAWWGKEFDRSRLDVSLGYASYESLHGSSSDYFRPSVTFRHELAERLSLLLSATAEIGMKDTDDDRYYARAGLRHELTEDAWLELSYLFKYVDQASRANWSDRTTWADLANRIGRADRPSYTVNRVMLEAYWKF